MSQKICSVNSNNKYTCFNVSSLKKIANKLNKDSRFAGYKNINIKSITKNNKKKAIKEIQKKLNCKKYLDFCVIEKEQDFYDEIKTAIKPKGPINKTEWLSTLDIRAVMEQYEKKYKGFNFIGPFPIDFDAIYEELSNLNLKKLCKEDKKIGMVFNTDYSNGPGEHWISLFLDLKDRTLCFFDSVGDKPPMQVWKLIKRIEKQSKAMKCPIKIIVNKKQFQFDNASCGVWSIWHIISRLRGESCSYIYNRTATDKLMYKKRKEYFRK
jgi:hypothetical protein